jgi:hypothetical protein
MKRIFKGLIILGIITAIFELLMLIMWVYVVALLNAAQVSSEYYQPKPITVESGTMPSGNAQVSTVGASLQGGSIDAVQGQ